MYIYTFHMSSDSGIFYRMPTNACACYVVYSRAPGYVRYFSYKKQHYKLLKWRDNIDYDIILGSATESHQDEDNNNGEFGRCIESVLTKLCTITFKFTMSIMKLPNGCISLHVLIEGVRISISAWGESSGMRCPGLQRFTRPGAPFTNMV